MTTCAAARLRCTICGNPDWHRRDHGEECTHCGLHVEDPRVLGTAAREIETRLAGGSATGAPADRWSLSPGAWRNAAWRFGFVLDGERAMRPDPSDHDVTLAVMTRPAEADAAATLVRDPGFPRAIVAVDAEYVDRWAGRFGNAHVIAHPLTGDFGAQRNRLQAAAGRGWVLQMDSDERPDPALTGALGWLVRAADRDGLRSLGLPRRNLVDGRLSALWPDIQYRLNRADVRFEGVVHERPVVPFAETSLALCGAIEHHLDAPRVRSRTRTYAALSPEGERIEDEMRLLRPFDPIADR